MGGPVAHPDLGCLLPSPGKESVQELRGRSLLMARVFCEPVFYLSELNNCSDD
jgi:hypothetical protein